MNNFIKSWINILEGVNYPKHEPEIKHNELKKSNNNKTITKANTYKDFVVHTRELLNFIYDEYSNNLCPELKSILDNRIHKKMIFFTNTNIKIKLPDKFKNIDTKLIFGLKSFQKKLNRINKSNQNIDPVLKVDSSCMKEYPIRINENNELLLKLDCPLGLANFMFKCNDDNAIYEVYVFNNPFSDTNRCYCGDDKIISNYLTNGLIHFQTNDKHYKYNLCLSNGDISLLLMEMLEDLSIEQRMNPYEITTYISDCLRTMLFVDHNLVKSYVKSHVMSKDGLSDSICTKELKMSDAIDAYMICNRNIDAILSIYDEKNNTVKNTDDNLLDEKEIKQIIDNTCDPILNNLNDLSFSRVIKLIVSIDLNNREKKTMIKKILIQNVSNISVVISMICSMLNILCIPTRVVTSEPVNKSYTEYSKSIVIKNINEASEGREISHVWLESWFNRPTFQEPFLAWLESNNLLESFEEYLLVITSESENQKFIERYEQVPFLLSLAKIIDPSKMIFLKELFNEWKSKLGQHLLQDLENFLQSLARGDLEQYMGFDWQMYDIDQDRIKIAPVKLIMNEHIFLQQEEINKHFYL